VTFGAKSIVPFGHIDGPTSHDVLTRADATTLKEHLFNVIIVK
jgi:hypothetical protein